ncbi:MAG: tannase/feruloyl esterase family alpha/beta hydrolase [Gemmatimonadales bacterium]|nr:tannase/feruloyl esterase family alpha/beta hydrolase [Gemmatimonadales bacterium]
MRSFVPVVSLLAAIAPSLAAQRPCASLTSLRLQGAVITEASPVAPGLFTPPPDGPPASPVKLLAHCRVRGTARPVPDSEIRFEVWLPEPGAWNGKFQQAGNGGYAGSIPAGSLANALLRGYATAGTDDGHVGMDPSFAIGHPEKVVDFGHRAVHLTAGHAKAVIEAYYGRAATRAYFVGCSDGGREALMEAQRYPADFDGIVVGAPANNWTRLLTSGVWNWRALNETPGSAIPVAKLGLIQRAAVAACDRLDQVADGLIEAPNRCRFDPASLQCRGADQPDCLTTAQLTALRKIYDGPRSPRTGERIYPGAIPGTEAVPGNWNPWIVASPQQPLPFIAWFGTTFYQSMVFENPAWDYRTMDFDRDLATALAKVGGVLDAVDPDLRAFRDRGGKMIQYHGWGDAAISATGSIDYYQQVLTSVGPGVPDFYRLFMVPGMGHCGGGIGPTDFGQFETGPTAADPDRDIVAALDRWVERGVAPERIIATGIRPGEPMSDPSKATRISRPLCVWPRIAQYRGVGSSDEAENFSCAAPPNR